MNIYRIYIKSHTDTPDFEEEIQAKTFKEAIEYWYKALNYDFSKSFLRKNIIKI